MRISVSQEQRKRYLNGELSHQQFYEWLAEHIGLTMSDLPVSVDVIRQSTDEHLNDIPLRLWDNRDGAVRYKARVAGIRSWSLSDSVCCLKALARKLTA